MGAFAPMSQNATSPSSAVFSCPLVFVFKNTHREAAVDAGKKQIKDFFPFALLAFA
jgi:hypothetical protein